MFKWIDFDEEEDQNEEGTLLDAFEKDLFLSPEASQVDPTALGFAPEDGFRLGTSLDPVSRVRVRMHSHQSDVEDELPVWSLAK